MKVGFLTNLEVSILLFYVSSIIKYICTKEHTDLVAQKSVSRQVKSYQLGILHVFIFIKKKKTLQSGADPHEIDGSQLTPLSLNEPFKMARACKVIRH